MIDSFLCMESTDIKPDRGRFRAQLKLPAEIILIVQRHPKTLCKLPRFPLCSESNDDDAIHPSGEVSFSVTMQRVGWMLENVSDTLSNHLKRLFHCSNRLLLRRQILAHFYCLVLTFTRHVAAARAGDGTINVTSTANNS